MIKKIMKVLKAIKMIALNPWLLNTIINQNEEWQKKTSFKNGLPQVSLEDLFPGFSIKLDQFSFLGGGSLPTDIALLKGLCKKVNDCIYFEIGTWRGESVVNVYQEAKECYTLNLSKKQIIELGFGENYANAHFFFSKDLENVTQLEGDSKTFDYSKLKKMDVIFIDGNHHYDYVKSDTQKVFNHLMHDDTVVVWHDYAFSPENVRFEVLNGILDGIPKEKQGQLFHVENTLCAIYLPHHKKSNCFLKAYDNPKSVFEIDITYKKI